jgi:hypothetical protein
MLRLAVLVLILANGLYYVWSQGMLAVYGFAPAVQTEPQRFTQQVQPEAITVLTPAEFKKIEEQVLADQSPKECLQAGPFEEVQAESLRKALDQNLPAEAWRLDPAPIPARWIVYMGKFANTQAQDKKRDELLAMKLRLEPLENASLEPGLSLGGFDSQAQANEELARLVQRGVRTARVVQERKEGRGSLLKLPAVTDAMRLRLSDFDGVLAGKPFKSCN